MSEKLPVELRESKPSRWKSGGKRPVEMGKPCAVRDPTRKEGPQLVTPGSYRSRRRHVAVESSDN